MKKKFWVSVREVKEWKVEMEFDEEVQTEEEAQDAFYAMDGHGWLEEETVTNSEWGVTDVEEITK